MVPTVAAMIGLVVRFRHLPPLAALARANVGIIRTTSKFLILVELFNLTFEREPGRNRDSNVKFAPLEPVSRESGRRFCDKNMLKQRACSANAGASRLGRACPRPGAGSVGGGAQRAGWGTFPPLPLSLIEADPGVRAGAAVRRAPLRPRLELLPDG